MVTTVRRMSTGKSSDTYADIFLARQEHVRKVCNSQGRIVPDTLINSTITDRMIIEPEHFIVYCPVEKVASTFWKRTLYTMMSNGRNTSPYDSGKTEKNGVQIYQTFRKRSTGLNIRELKSTAESLLVVRDPYVKLFSGYVDKLFHPNYLFWKVYGERIKRDIRKYDNPNSGLVCGNDITFSEYVRYIIFAIHDGIHLNSHFTSITKHCDPCVTKYTYISKIETLKPDFKYIMNRWNQKHHLNISIQDWETEGALQITRLHIKLSFTTLEKFGRICNMRKYLFLQRTWRFLQISGIVSKHYPLPFIDDVLTAEFVTEDNFVQAVENIIKKQPSWDIVHKQRREALIEAYQSLNEDELMGLREYVLTDCQYFDYNDKPTALFSRNQTDSGNETSDSYKYFDMF